MKGEGVEGKLKKIEKQNENLAPADLARIRQIL
jgi:hypothetical protein